MAEYMIKIILYESTAGDLILWDAIGEHGYDVTAVQHDCTFEPDARELALGNTDGWTVPEVAEIEEGYTAVLEWTGGDRLALITGPGHAAANYAADALFAIYQADVEAAERDAEEWSDDLRGW